MIQQNSTSGVQRSAEEYYVISDHLERERTFLLIIHTMLTFQREFYNILYYKSRSTTFFFLGRPRFRFSVCLDT